MNRVRNVGLPVGDRAFLGGERLHDAAQPREHGETAVLELLDLELFEVTRLGEAERVEAATRGDVTDGEFVEDRVGNAGTVRFGGANENDLDDENVPEGRVARAFRRERATAPGNLSATAVQSSGVHKVPAVNHGMPVPFSAVQAPVTPSIPQRPWMTSRSAFFSSPNGMIGDSPPPG